MKILVTGDLDTPYLVAMGVDAKQISVKHILWHEKRGPRRDDLIILSDSPFNSIFSPS
jgi:hypothetical protein